MLLWFLSIKDFLITNLFNNYQKKMKKILIIFPGLRVKNDEGSKHRLNCHINEYRNRGYEVDVLVFCKDAKFRCDSKFLNKNAHWIIRPYLIPMGKNVFLAKCLIAYQRFITALHTWYKKYDVVQMEIYGTCSPLCRKRPLYITDFHGDSVNEKREMNRLKPWVWDFLLLLQDKSIKQSDVCIVVSENLRHQLETNTGSKIKDYSLISCGVDVERFNKAQCAQIEGLDLSNRIVLGYCGGFHGWQNFDKMIDLVTRLRKLDQRVFLLAFSNSSVEPYKEKLAELGKENYCIKGLQSHEVPSHLKLMDAGLLLRSNLILNIVSSPTKICEYLAAGVPLICTQYSGDYARSVTHKVNGYVGADPVFTDTEVKDLLEWLKNVKANRGEIAQLCTESVAERTFEAEFNALEEIIETNRK